MKIVIDISEEYRHDFDINKCADKFDCLATNEFGYVLRKAFKNGTIIPYKATNKDVIKTLYPQADDYGINEGLEHISLDGVTITVFPANWWNAIYTGNWR